MVILDAYCGSVLNNSRISDKRQPKMTTTVMWFIRLDVKYSELTSKSNKNISLKSPITFSVSMIQRAPAYFLH